MSGNENVFSRASSIRMNGESWQNAVQRAGSQLRYETQMGGAKTGRGSGQGGKYEMGNKEGTSPTNMCFVGRTTGRCKVSQHGKSEGGTRSRHDDVVNKHPQSMGRSAAAFSRQHQSSLFSHAKQIRKPGEEWQEAIQRAAEEQKHGASPSRGSPGRGSPGRGSPARGSSGRGSSDRGSSARAPPSRGPPSRGPPARGSSGRGSSGRGSASRRPPPRQDDYDDFDDYDDYEHEHQDGGAKGKSGRGPGRPKGTGHPVRADHKPMGRKHGDIATTSDCYYNDETDRCNVTKLGRSKHNKLRVRNDTGKVHRTYHNEHLGLRTRGQKTARTGNPEALAQYRAQHKKQATPKKSPSGKGRGRPKGSKSGARSPGRARGAGQAVTHRSAAAEAKDFGHMSDDYFQGGGGYDTFSDTSSTQSSDFTSMTGGSTFSDTSSTRSSDFTSFSDTTSMTGGSSISSDTLSSDSSSIW